MVHGPPSLLPVPLAHATGLSLVEMARLAAAVMFKVDLVDLVPDIPRPDRQMATVVLESRPLRWVTAMRIGLPPSVDRFVDRRLS